MSKPLISIIIPVYNAEKYLPACLDSVLNQSYENFELILINDGSKDGSLSICKKYEQKDNRITLVTIKNSGVSAARNKGLEVARGEYIAFVDSDDIVSGNYLSYLFSKASPSTDLVCAKYKNFKNSLSFSEKQSSTTFSLSSREAIDYLLAEKLHGGPVCKLYRGKIAKKTKFENFDIAEDTLYNYNFLTNSKEVVICDGIIYGYRINMSSITRRAVSEERIDGIRVFERIAKQEKESTASIIRLFMEGYYILELLDLLHTKNPRLSKRCISIIKSHRSTVLKSKLSSKKQKIIAFLSFLNPRLPAHLINTLKKLKEKHE